MIQTKPTPVSTRLGTSIVISVMLVYLFSIFMLAENPMEILTFSASSAGSQSEPNSLGVTFSEGGKLLGMAIFSANPIEDKLLVAVAIIVLAAALVAIFIMFRMYKLKGTATVPHTQFKPVESKPLNADQYALNYGKRFIQSPTIAPKARGLKKKLDMKSKYFRFRYRKMHEQLKALEKEYLEDPYSITKQKGYVDHWHKMRKLRGKLHSE